MSWVKIDDDFHAHPKVLAAGNAGVGVYAKALSYSARYLTDGFVPSTWAHAQVTQDDDIRLLSQLSEAGLWESVPGGFQIADYLDYNPSREQVLRDRERERGKQRARRGAKRTPGSPPGTPEGTPMGTTEGTTEGSPAGSPRGSHPAPVPVPVPKENSLTSEANASDLTLTTEPLSLPSKEEQPLSEGQTARASEREKTPEIIGLCELLADRVVANGSKRPTREQRRGWRRDVRLMLEQDDRTLEQIEGAIRWSQADAFWRSNVLSMGAVREHFDQMRLQAERSKASGNAGVVRMLRQMQEASP